jgi:hypothetical protein
MSIELMLQLGEPSRWSPTNRVHTESYTGQIPTFFKIATLRPKLRAWPSFPAFFRVRKTAPDEPLTS